MIGNQDGSIIPMSYDSRNLNNEMVSRQGEKPISACVEKGEASGNCAFEK
jgi:hypothetical protein